MPETKRKKMKISPFLGYKAPAHTALTLADFKPAKSLATNDDVWALQDAQLSETNVYSLIEHAIDMGLYAPGSRFMGYAALSTVMQDGLVSACVNTLANDMTREFIDLDMSGDDSQVDGDKLVADIMEDLSRHQVKQMLNRAVKLVQQYGGCQIFIDTNKTAAEDLIAPLNDLEKQSFRRFILLEPINTSPGDYDTSNPLDPRYFVPDYWWVMTQKVHKSRLITLRGDEVSTLLKPSYNFYGVPHVQRIYDAILHFKQNMLAANRLLNKYSHTIIKTNLEGVLDGGDISQVDRRIQLYVNSHNNDGVFAIDSETEDVVILQTSLAGVRDLLQQSLEFVAVLDRKPVVKLLGISPSGFSTGDADIDNYYDSVKAQQEEMLRVPLQEIINILQLARYKVINPNLEFDFVELSKEDEQAAATVRKTAADTDAVLIQNGVISATEARARLKMSNGSGYDSLEEDIDTDIYSDLLEGLNADPETNTESGGTASVVPQATAVAN